MTEADWLAATDPMAMLEHLVGKVSDRRLRLFTCAFFRTLYAPADPRTAIVEVGERQADGTASPDEVRAAQRAAVQDPARQATWVVVCDDLSHSLLSVFHHEFSFLVHPRNGARYCALVRDIFGDLYRPVPFDPRWRTQDVQAVARRMYDGHDFRPMPILADALMDAGCDSDTILSHCRSGGPHVRGCWVADAALGWS